MFGYLWRVEKEKSERKWKFNVEIFTLFDVKMIQIWTFPADPSTERVPSLAERVAYLRHPINLRLFNWRVPALLVIQVILIYFAPQQLVRGSGQGIGHPN